MAKGFFLTKSGIPKHKRLSYTRVYSVYRGGCKPLTCTLYCGIQEVKSRFYLQKSCVYLTWGFHEACVSRETPTIS